MKTVCISCRRPGCVCRRWVGVGMKEAARVVVGERAFHGHGQPVRNDRPVMTSEEVLAFVERARTGIA